VCQFLIQRALHMRVYHVQRWTNAVPNETCSLGGMQRKERLWLHHASAIQYHDLSSGFRSSFPPPWLGPFKYT
jgi:hypothetical protein